MRAVLLLRRTLAHRRFGPPCCLSPRGARAGSARHRLERSTEFPVNAQNTNTHLCQKSNKMNFQHHLATLPSKFAVTSWFPSRAGIVCCHRHRRKPEVAGIRLLATIHSPYFDPITCCVDDMHRIMCLNDHLTNGQMGNWKDL